MQEFFIQPIRISQDGWPPAPSVEAHRLGPVQCGLPLAGGLPSFVFGGGHLRSQSPNTDVLQKILSVPAEA